MHRVLFLTIFVLQSISCFSQSFWKIENEYDLILPDSDYYTCEGKSLNKIGIEPDITVSGEDALNYVLKTL